MTVDTTDHEFREDTPVTEPATETANEQANTTIEDIKDDVDKRDDAILAELKAIHESINAQTEHHIRHLESHTVSQAAPVQQTANDIADHATESLPDEPVSLEISEPKDMPKEDKPEHKTSRKFGKRGRRA